MSGVRPVAKAASRVSWMSRKSQYMTGEGPWLSTGDSTARSTSVLEAARAGSLSTVSLMSSDEFSKVFGWLILLIASSDCGPRNLF